MTGAKIHVSSSDEVYPGTNDRYPLMNYCNNITDWNAVNECIWQLLQFLYGIHTWQWGKDRKKKRRKEEERVRCRLFECNYSKLPSYIFECRNKWLIETQANSSAIEKKNWNKKEQRERALKASVCKTLLFLHFNFLPAFSSSHSYLIYLPALTGYPSRAILLPQFISSSFFSLPDSNPPSSPLPPTLPPYSAPSLSLTPSPSFSSESFSSWAARV